MGLLATGLVAHPSGAAPAPAGRTPSRIVLVSIDGLGEARAGADRMPALAALIARGARCEQARSPSGLTFPATTALLTGRSPASTAVLGEGAAGFPPEGAALAPALATLGYHGIALPADPFAHSGTGIARGFTRFVREAPALAESARVDTALAWLARSGKRFAWLGLSFGEAGLAWRREDGPAFADSGARALRARDVDRAIARLVAELGRRGMASGTLLAVVGTHGLPGDADPRRVPIAFIPLDSAGTGPIPGETGLVDVAPSLVAAARGSTAGFDGHALLGSAKPRTGRPAEAPAEPASPCRGELPAGLLDERSSPDSVMLVRVHALVERCPEDRRLAIEEAVALSRANRELEGAERFVAIRNRWPQDPASALAYAQHLVRYQRFDIVDATLAPIPRTSPFAAEAAWLEVAALAGGLRFSEAAAASRRAVELIVPQEAYGRAAATFDRLREAQRVADVRPNDAAAQLAYGRQLGEYGLHQEAYRHLHRARFADTTSAEPDYWIATFLMNQGNFRPAAQTLERALKTDPNHHPSRVALAEALIHLDRWKEAIPHLERAVAEDPKDARSAYNLACVLARDGKPDQALRMLQRAVDAGYANASHMAVDPDLATLRDRAEFQALLARMPGGR